MNKTTQIIIGIIVAIIILAGIWYGLSKKPTAPTTKEPIKIGWIGPLTGGPAFLGENARLAAEFMVHKINEAGGVKGRKIQVIFEDSQGDSKIAVNAAQKLINVDKVKVIITVISGDTLAVAPIAETNKVVLIATNAAHPDITKAGDYIFRVFPSDVVRGKLYASLINSHNVSKLALLIENAAFTKGLADIFEKEYSTLGKQIAIKEFYEPNATDFKSQLLKIKDVKPEAIFLLVNSKQTAVIIGKQIKELGIESKLFGTYIFLDRKLIQENKDLFEGLIALDVSQYIKTKELIDEYEKFHNKKLQLSFFLASYADVFNILSKAIEKCGEDPTCIKNFLYNVKEYDGELGKISFDKNGDIVGVGYAEWQITNGEPIEVRKLY